VLPVAPCNPEYNVSPGAIPANIDIRAANWADSVIITGPAGTNRQFVKQSFNRSLAIVYPPDANACQTRRGRCTGNRRRKEGQPKQRAGGQVTAHALAKDLRRLMDD